MQARRSELQGLLRCTAEPAPLQLLPRMHAPCSAAAHEVHVHGRPLLLQGAIFTETLRAATWRPCSWHWRQTSGSVLRAAAPLMPKDGEQLGRVGGVSGAKAEPSGEGITGHAVHCGRCRQEEWSNS